MYSSECSCLVSVSRFTVPDGEAHSMNLVHRKALFRVTNLVRARLRVADETIAVMSNGGMTVDGLRDGRTEVQVRMKLCAGLG